MKLEVGKLYCISTPLFLYPSQDRAEEGAVSKRTGFVYFYFPEQKSDIVEADEIFLVLKVGRKIFDKTPTLVLTTNKKIGWANLLEVNPI